MDTKNEDQRIADRLAIQDVMYRWARGVDRRDWDLVRSVFHPDGYDDHGIYRGGVDGLIEWLRVRHSTILQSMHHIANILIEFTGPDRALVESYAVGYQRYANAGRETRVAILGDGVGSSDAEIDMVMPGRYVDRFERRSGKWKILHRTVVFETVAAKEVGNGAQLNPSWTLARRDGDDTINRERTAAGLK
jgi:SnoaL-like domain